MEAISIGRTIVGFGFADIVLGKIRPFMAGAGFRLADIAACTIALSYHPGWRGSTSEKCGSWLTSAARESVHVDAPLLMIKECVLSNVGD